MDVRYINPFTKSICNTFDTMCKLPVNIERPRLKKTDEDGSDVSSIIGFSGDAAGSLVLHFSFETAARIATAFAGVEIDPDHEDFADALGELANMVAGGAKSEFEGMNISMSLPNVIIGKNHYVCPSKITPRIVFPCSTEAGRFEVEVGMEVTATSQSKSVAAPAGVSAS